MTEWHIIIHKPRGMKTAIASLESLGHEVYPPREKISIIRLSKRIKVEKALLHEYLFLGIVPGSELYPIRNARGVLKLMNDIDGNPEQISQRTVERFRKDERKGIHDYTRRGNGGKPFKRGTCVSVIAGPWDNWGGDIASCGLSHAWVNIVGETSTMRIKLPVDDLVAA